MNNNYAASRLKHAFFQAIESLEILPREINHLPRLMSDDEENEISHEKLLTIAIEGLRIHLVETDTYLLSQTLTSPTMILHSE